MMSEIKDLQARFGIPNRLRIVNGPDHLPCLQITSDLCQGQIYLHGAHVTAWQPAGQKPVIWMSQKSWFEPNKPIRGGVPICFPWFGPHPDNADLPAHGFARLRSWELTETRQAEGGAIEVMMLLQSSAETRPLWPFDFELRYHVSFGRTLVLELETKNTSRSAMTVGEALHTYFAVGDVRQVRVTGCEGKQFIDKVDEKKMKVQDGAIVFTGETDRVYLGATGENVIEDSAMGRKITVKKSGSPNTVVWNPWVAKAKAMADFGDEEWPGMVCVETCHVPPSALELPAGAVHGMRAVVGAATI